MEVVSLLQFPATAFRWRFGSGGYRVTVVTKATYDLKPLKAELATGNPVPIARADEPFDGDPSRSLRIASDLAPYKLRPEVLVVGSAYAADLRPVRSLVARAVVGDMEKAVEVLCDRSVTIQGALREGPMFKQMPIVYERAAGGPDSWNLAGIPASNQDASGASRLPNIVPVGTPFQATDVAPVGMGPLAPHWSLRSDLLRSHAATWRHGVYGSDLVVPDDLDLRYFNSAPSDQQLEGAMPGGLHLILEHLHPSGSRLSTYLPEIRPNVVATIGARRETVPMIADTVLVDTDASRCTITFRAVLVLESANQQLGLALIDGSGTLAEALRTAELGVVDPLTPAIDVTQVGTVGLDKPSLPFESSAISARASLPDLQKGLPFSNQNVPPPPASTPGHVAPPAAVPQAVMPPAPVPPAAVPPPSASGGGSSLALLGTPLRPPPASRIPPPGPSRPASVPAPPPVTVPQAVTVPHAVSVPPSVPPPAVVPATVAATARPSTPGSSAGVYGTVKERPTYLHSETPKRDGGPIAPVAHSQKAAHEGALAASDAAAGIQTQPARKAPVETRAVSEPPPPAPERDLVEVIWHVQDIVEEAKRARALKHVFATGKEKRVMLATDERGLEETKKARELARLLGHPSAMSEMKALENAVHEVIDDSGVLIAALVLAHGDIAVRLDQRKVLEALIGMMKPLAGSDKNIAEAVENAQLFASNEWSAPKSIEIATTRLRETAAKAQREVAAAQLQATAERMVLEKRGFETRSVLGGEHVRGDFHLGTGSIIPIYMPMACKDELPLFERFPARVVGEVRLKQDSQESAPIALLARAVARRHSRRS